MSKRRNRIGHRMCLFLALVSLVSGAVLANYLWKHSAFAQAAISQAPSPGWSFTGSLNTAHAGFTATLLTNGKVLVAGGALTCASAPLSSAEIYDPATRTWSYTGSLIRPRYDHTATLLPNGKVLVAGGTASDDTNPDIFSAELYDPATGTWSGTGSLNSIYGPHTATLLKNGKALAVGGYGAYAAEIYDPATGRWTETGIPNTIRYGYLAAPLPNGKALFVGGNDIDNNIASAELYDPDTGRWSVTGSLNTIRDISSATLLTNGKVLVIGCGDVICLRKYAEIYDPASGTWSNTGAPSSYAWPAILLPNGKVLSPQRGYSELYDPATGRWSSTTGLNVGIGNPTLLSDGNVLFPNVYFDPPSVCVPGSAALFDYRLAPSGTVSNVSAASYSLTGLASEAIAAAFDAGLATTTSAANTLPLPIQLAGTTVKIKDSAGDERLAPLFFVSPTQVNYQIPAGTAAGAATVTITSGNGAISNGVAFIQAVAPGLFTANGNGQGVAAALALRVKADGSRQFESIAQFDAAQNKFVGRPLDLGPEGEQVFLILFGTGIRHRSSLSAVIATIGCAYSEVSFAGVPPAGFVGLDQVNVRAPRTLAGRGEIDVLLTVDAQMANAARVNIK